jgi:hypothetical protein
MNTTLSNFAKIVDPNSEYYGQVFEVDIIHTIDQNVDLVEVNENRSIKRFIGNFTFSQIQFCVTKDNEPVKIGEEYVCIGDLVTNEEIMGTTTDSIYDYYEVYKDINLIIGTPDDHDVISVEDDFDEYTFKPLHPTNKIKITAEGKEYWISRDDFNKITK